VKAEYNINSELENGGHMKKSSSKRSRGRIVPVVLSDNCIPYYTSHGFDFFLQSLQICLGGIAACGVLCLLCSDVLDPMILPLLLTILLIALALCSAGWWIEAMYQKRHSRPIVGLTEQEFYLQDGRGALVTLNQITEIHYRFGQLRKRGTCAALILYLKAGKPVEAVLPSLTLVLALRKALPSVKWRVSWIVRLIVCLLIGASVGGLLSLVFLLS
jgi:hypothetical protein